MKKKILFITHSTSLTGGAEDDFERLLRYFSGQNDKYELYGLFPDGPRFEVYSKYCVKCGFYKWGFLPVINEGYFDYFKYLYKLFTQSYQVLRFTYKIKFDLCVVNVIVLLWPIVVMLLKKTKVAIFVREEVYPVWLRHGIYKLFSGKCSYFIPNSKTKKGDIEKTIKKQCIDFIYPAIEDYKPDIFTDLKNVLSKEAVIKVTDSGKFKFFNIGYICKRKNQKMIIEAMIQIKNSRHEIPYLIFAGKLFSNNVYYQEMLKLISDNGLEEYCTILGELTREQVYEVIKKIDSTIISSVSEGLPISMIESFKFGKPVISTKVGGITEIITDMENGMLVELDKAELANAMLKLMDDKVLYDKLAKDLESTFEKEFNLKEAMIKTDNIFNKIIKSG